MTCTPATVTPLPEPRGPAARAATKRHYLMCRPSFFAVEYAINPWMDPAVPVDRDLAVAQWERLRGTYLALGHQVSLIDPVLGLPDMVFAANGGLVIDATVLGARFRARERAAEAAVYRRWFTDRFRRWPEVVEPCSVNEGEGDFLVLDDVILAGTGFRTEPAAHAQAQELFGRPVVSLRLIDPRFYHLDTALAVLGGGDIAYYPPAFSPGSRAVLRRLFPDAVLADAADAGCLGLNAVSDGHHVVLPVEAGNLATALRARGYDPIKVEVSELRKAGGGPKCATLEIRG